MNTILRGRWRPLTHATESLYFAVLLLIGGTAFDSRADDASQPAREKHSSTHKSASAGSQSPWYEDDLNTCLKKHGVQSVLQSGAADCVLLLTTKGMSTGMLRSVGCPHRVVQAEVLGRIRAHTYEIAIDWSGDFESRHALLNTRGSDFDSGGVRIRFCVAERVEKKAVPLDNGFTDTWLVFTEEKPLTQ